MSFFKDFKDDLSQAVNELLPEGETDNFEEPEMVDTLTEESEFDANDLEGMLAAAIEKIPEVPAEEALEIKEDEPEKESEDLLKEEYTEGIEEIEEIEEQTEEEPILEDEVEEVMSKGQISAFSDGPATDENGIITDGMVITGNITSRGSLEIVGSVIGDIDVKGKLNISGTIQGNSKGAEIFADAAKVTGEIQSEGAVKVGQSSVIIGNISATSAVIAGAVKGDIDVHGPVILDTSAIVMGNIKSKSVQINNGAVIEGHCSQCYAEVSPTNFFSEKVK